MRNRSDPKNRQETPSIGDAHPEYKIQHIRTVLMASFRNHRIVIASLFLPTTAVLGESPPVTPENDDVGLTLPAALGPETTISAVAQRLAEQTSATKGGLLNTHSRSHSMTVPLKSIVEDLRDKVRPSIEILNYLFW